MFDTSSQARVRRVLRTWIRPLGTWFMCLWENCEGGANHCAYDHDKAHGGQRALRAKMHRIRATHALSMAQPRHRFRDAFGHTFAKVLPDKRKRQMNAVDNASR